MAGIKATVVYKCQRCEKTVRKGAKFCPSCNVANFLENRKPMAPRKKVVVDYKEAGLRHLKQRVADLENMVSTLNLENIALRNRIREITNEKTTR